MPKEIKDLKDFIKIMRGVQDENSKHLPKAEKITIKKNKKTNVTKFKLRTSKYLITLKVDGRVRAEKIKQSIPAGKSDYHSIKLLMVYFCRSQEGVKGMSNIVNSVRGIYRDKSIIFMLQAINLLTGIAANTLTCKCFTGHERGKPASILIMTSSCQSPW